jgi:hypothetical protein
MTADERLALIRVKVERAQEHIRDLAVEVRSFLAANPFVIATKRDPETRQLIYYVASVRETPVRIAAILGDVIHNLRSALDHLAYQLVWIGTGKTPSSRTYFPIADNCANYSARRSEQVQGARPEAINAIDSLKPYKGGNDTLWKLHKLNNVDKHRILIAVGSAFQSINLAAFVWRQHIKFRLASDPNNPHNPAFAGMPPINGFFRPADRMFPLKQGDELFVDLPDAEVDDQLQFRFEVAFGEPQILEGEPLIETLQKMADLVDNIILSFKPLLA